MTTFSTPGPCAVAGGTEKVSRRPSSLRRTPFTSVTRNAVWWIWKLWYWLSVLTTDHFSLAPRRTDWYIPIWTEYHPLQVETYPDVRGTHQTSDAGGFGHPLHPSPSSR